MKNNLYDLTLYASALCNQRCKYCFIYKSPLLQKVEDEIIEYCNVEYYDDFMEKLSPYFNYDKMKTISLWGGEPSIGFKRFTPIICHYFEKYSSLQEVMFSSNFTYEHFLEYLEYMVKNLYKVRNNLIVNVQLSLDGPVYINDSNRGKGVTEKSIENYKYMIDIFKELPDTMLFKTQTKGTLTIEDVKNLCESNKVQEYFDFYRLNITTCDKCKDNIRSAFPNVNMVAPSQYTQEDGYILAEFAEKCQEYSNKIGIDVFWLKRRLNQRIEYLKNNTYCGGYGFCG